MSLLGVLATQIQVPAPHPFGLFINGVDVIRDPAMSSGGAPTFGVDPASIELEENGPGGVSRFTFTLNDPQSRQTFIEGAEVIYWDFTNDVALFRGWLDIVEATAAYGDQGKDVAVTAIGPEAALDWLIVPADTVFASGTTIGVAVQQLLSICTGVGIPLRWFGGSSGSTRDLPIDIPPIVGDSALASSLTIAAGTTAREGIRQLSQVGRVGISEPTGNTYSATVDWYLGVRFFSSFNTLTVVAQQPFDYSQLTVLPLPTVLAVAEGLRHGFEGSQVRTVQVQGNGVSATVSDGTGRVGAGATLVDNTLTTTAQCVNAGKAYLAQYAANVRGSYSITGTSRSIVPTTVHAGSLTAITNGPLGLNQAINIYPISQIIWTWKGSGLFDIRVTYGAPRRSVVRLLRRWTRTTLS